MLNLFTVSMLQKNFEAHSLFSIAKHRWVETGSNRQFSELLPLYINRPSYYNCASKPADCDNMAY